MSHDPVGVRRVRREDVSAAVLVAVLVVALVVLVSLVLIGSLYEPDGFLGRPGQIPACGGTYQLEPGPPRVWTLDEIRAATDPADEPQIFEPILGHIPLGSLLAGDRDLNGVPVCATVGWLHVASDAYLRYAQSP